MHCNSVTADFFPPWPVSHFTGGVVPMTTWLKCANKWQLHQVQTTRPTLVRAHTHPHAKPSLSEIKLRWQPTQGPWRAVAEWNGSDGGGDHGTVDNPELFLSLLQRLFHSKKTKGSRREALWPGEGGSRRRSALSVPHPRLHFWVTRLYKITWETGGRVLL